jgi:hypothetical protein
MNNRKRILRIPQNLILLILLITKLFMLQNQFIPIQIFKELLFIFILITNIINNIRTNFNQLQIRSLINNSFMFIRLQIIPDQFIISHT